MSFIITDITDGQLEIRKDDETVFSAKANTRNARRQLVLQFLDRLSA